MQTVLLVISVLLIIIVLLQSNKAESGSQILSGGNSDLFSQRKERGVELLISRVTLSLGLIFFLVKICLLLLCFKGKFSVIVGNCFCFLYTFLISL